MTKGFQSTLPRRERPALNRRHNWNMPDFNPRSREGSDITDRADCVVAFRFQSTLPRRERLQLFKMGIYRRCYFNPRSREGSDMILCFQKGGVASISIHAPAKGATDYEVLCMLDTLYFNPRSREGSDKIPFGSPSTLNNFNPRSREGSDADPYNPLLIKEISIHAPAKGATAILYNKFHFLCIILYILSAIT